VSMMLKCLADLRELRLNLRPVSLILFTFCSLPLFFLPATPKEHRTVFQGNNQIPETDTGLRKKWTEGSCTAYLLLNGTT